MVKKKKKDLKSSEESGFTPDEGDELPEDLEAEDEPAEEEEEPSSKKGKKGKKEDVEEEEPLEEEEPEGEEEEEELSFLEDEEFSEEERPIATKVNERMKKAFNRKLTELDKKYKGKTVVGNYDELLKNPQFMEWAKRQVTGAGYAEPGVDVARMSIDEAVQSWSSLTDTQRRTYFTALKPEQRQLFRLQLQVNQMAQQSLGSREAELESKAIERFGDNYKAKRDSIIQLRREIQSNPYVTHEEAFKVLDYDDYGRRMYHAGRLKGKKDIDDVKNLPRKGGPAAKPGKKKAMTVREAMEMAEREEAEA